MASKTPTATGTQSHLPAAILLRKTFEQMQKKDSDDTSHGVSIGLINDNMFEWKIKLMLNEDVQFYGGGCFSAIMKFPEDYPNKPPTMKFTPPIWHPNVYPDGRVCISILNPPVEDSTGYEQISERWSPVQTPSTIILSVISMLNDPNDGSPANVDASKQFREDKKAFRRACRKCVEASYETNE